MTAQAHPADPGAELIALAEADLRDGDRALASLIGRLIDIEARDVHLREGYKSMYAFCIKRLRLSHGGTQRRLEAARLARRYPRLLDAIRNSRIHLSAIGTLKELFNETNVEFLVEKAFGKTHDELDRLYAQLRPRPDVPSQITRLPDEAPSGSSRTITVSAHERRPPGTATEAELEGPPAPPEETPSQPPRRTKRPLKRFEALAPGRNKVQFTASDPQRDRLEHALDLMSHANPSRDLAVLVDAALDLLIPALEKRRGISKPARASTDERTSKDPTYFDRATSHEMWERDGQQCTYLSPSGERCTGTAFLEKDHVIPVAEDGTGEKAEDGRILCSAHNRFMAREILGREFVESAKEFNERKRTERKRGRVEQGLRALSFDAKQIEDALRVLEQTGWHRPYAELLQEALAALERPDPPPSGRDPPKE